MPKIQFSATKLHRCVYPIIIGDTVQYTEGYVRKTQMKL